MKRIRKRLKELTDKLLGSKSLTQEECEAAQSELKTLRELIQTHKALSAYENDYGDGDDEPKQKRVSDEKWD